ncbi:endonuclease VII domain-containing protein [Streptomyces collinus]|uniref:endonuclease VII domain-containing protein n=1 Tax=Streptomyces collinus TaxID=42684 RepID=UPI0037FFD8A7
MQEALTPELERRCGNPECGTSLVDRPGKLVRYCSIDCRTRASYLRSVERWQGVTEKLCTACNETKPIADFTQPHFPFCKPCTSAKAKERYRKPGRGKDMVYAKNLRQYGMTMEQYEEKARQQDGKCAICGTMPDHRLHVDHDHRTGAVRDLLCRPCNYALGNAQDSLRVVRAMVTYLERHAEADAASVDEAPAA